MLLALDTATDRCTVALARDGHVIASRTTDAPRAHAARLAPFVADVLAEAGVGPEALAAVAVSAGPGSFTGLRIGLSTAKGLCLATGAGLVLVPTLDVYRDAAASVDGAVWAVLPSRRGEVYAATAGRAPAAVPLDALAAWVGSPDVTFVGPAAGAASDAVPGARVHALDAGALTASLVRLASERAVRGAFDSVGDSEPLYVQAFEPVRRV